MDERVYEVEVCSSCLTQPPRGWDEPCPNCGGHDLARVRFRVARSQVLNQADPHRSLVERTVYFGCVGQAGHHYWLRGSGGRPYSRPGRSDDVTPWGYQVDGGLFPKRSGADFSEGVAHVVHHDDGWTALAFTDRSVDHRPGSWSVFCIPAVLDGTEALTIARAAFPTIFARYKFEVRLAT